MYHPFVSIVIPVGGNRVGNIQKLKECIGAIANQDYDGKIEVLLVIDHNNESIRSEKFPMPVRFVRFQRPEGFAGRDTSLRSKMGWTEARGQILGLTGVSIIFPPDLVRRAVTMMQEWNVEAIDGITERLPQDHSFLARFQDTALITEFPKYHRTFVLDRTTIGTDKRMPSMTSFFMTAAMFERCRPYMPVISEHGWEDFSVTNGMVMTCGERILCANELVAYRNHAVTLRLGKQFTSGVSGMLFCAKHPGNAYSRLRAKQVLLAGGAITYGLSLALMAVALRTTTALGYLGLLGALAWFVTGTANAARARSLEAFFFPPITALQVAIWTLGFYYTAVMDGEPDNDLLHHLHANR